MSIFTIELAPEAVRDLENLYEYVAATRSHAEATALLDRFARRIDALEQFPERGSIPPEMADLGVTDFRQLLMAPYRLVYRVAKREVSILLIADGRRDMKELLGRRLIGD